VLVSAGDELLGHRRSGHAVEQQRMGDDAQPAGGIFILSGCEHVSQRATPRSQLASEDSSAVILR
jgi:hypothetical protein